MGTVLQTIHIAKIFIPCDRSFVEQFCLLKAQRVLTSLVISSTANVLAKKVTGAQRHVDSCVSRTDLCKATTRLDCSETTTRSIEDLRNILEPLYYRKRCRYTFGRVRKDIVRLERPQRTRRSPSFLSRRGTNTTLS